MARSLEHVRKTAATARLYARVGLRRMTPLKAYRMMRYWMLTSILRKNIPWVMEFSVTYRCQCKCVHCSVAGYLSEANKRNELTNDEIKSLFEQAARIGIPKIDFFGGEPLIREGITDLIRFGAKKGLYISVTTNGWLLTRQLAEELGDAGISCVNISLDNISADKHDRLRGLPGIYDRAVAGIRYCHEAGIPCIVSTYVTHTRIRNFGTGESDDSQLNRIISLSRSLGASGIRILFPILSGKWAEDKKQAFSEKEQKLVMNNIDRSFAFIEGAYSVRNGKKVCQSLSGKMFNISPYGDIQLCVTFPETFGNVKDKPLGDLLKFMYSHPVYLRNKDGSCCTSGGLERQPVQ